MPDYCPLEERGKAAGSIETPILVDGNVKYCAPSRVCHPLFHGRLPDWSTQSLLPEDFYYEEPPGSNIFRIR
jgi:hypothetical protein